MAGSSPFTVMTNIFVTEFKPFYCNLLNSVTKICVITVEGLKPATPPPLVKETGSLK